MKPVTTAPGMSVMLVDDHPIVRQGFKVFLSRELPHAVFVECSSGADALSHLEREAIDFIILDLSLRDRDGIQVLRSIRSLRPRLPVLIVSMHDEDQFATWAIQLGASGYLTKEAAPDKLILAVRTILAGGKYISEALSRRLASAPKRVDGLPHAALSGRELQVLKLIVLGKTVKQIGLELGVSNKTISAHRRRILDKLESHTTAELVRYALKARLFEGHSAERHV